VDGIGQPVQPGCQPGVIDSSRVSPPYVAMRPRGAQATEPCAYEASSGQLSGRCPGV
jgi:hypothetical protein